MAGDLLGVDVSRVEATPEFKLGTIADQAIGEFIYVQFLLLTDKGEVVILSADNRAEVMTLIGASTAFGARIGVSVSDAFANDYGWVQVRGDIKFQADASATANTQMYATAVAGQIGITEADGGALANIVLTEAAGAMAGLASGRLLNPTAGAATGSGGGGGGGVDASATATVSERPIFSAALANIASIAGAATWTNVLSGLTTNTLLNIGGFTVETVLTRDAVIIPANGNYEVSTTITGLASDSTAGTARSTLIAQFVRERAGVDATLLPQGTPSYSRNQYGEYSQLLGSHMSTVLPFETGDKIRVQILFRVQSSNPTVAIVGAKSNLTIKREDSPEVEVAVSGIFDRLAVAEFGDVHEFEDTDIGKLVNIHSDLHEIIAETDSPVGGTVTWGLLSATVAAFKGTLALWTELGQLTSPTNGDIYYVVQDGAFYIFRNSFWNVHTHPDGSMVPFIYNDETAASNSLLSQVTATGNPDAIAFFDGASGEDVYLTSHLHAELGGGNPLPGGGLAAIERCPDFAWDGV